MFQVVHLDVVHVVMAIYACFKRLFQMFKVFRLDVTKVNLDIAYIAIAIHACFKHMF
jgi:hypothetical protein